MKEGSKGNETLTATVVILVGKTFSVARLILEKVIRSEKIEMQ